MNKPTQLLFAAALLASSAAAQNSYNITPFLTCQDYDANTNTLTAYFGYESHEANAIVQILVGNDNRFVPNPADRGQPALYFPGLYERAFRATLPGNQITQWILLGAAVTVSRDSTPCRTLPTLSLPAGTVGTPYSQQLAAMGSLVTPTWSLLSTPPPGLTLSSAGLLQGTPLTAGAYQLTVQAADAQTTDTRTYQLRIGAGTTINDAISTRAPGFTPQFRTVTNVTAAVTATASCNATEFVVTGGGACTVPNTNTIQGRIATNQPASNGWTVSCSGGAATAVVVCQVK